MTATRSVRLAASALLVASASALSSEDTIRDSSSVQAVHGNDDFAFPDATIHRLAFGSCHSANKAHLWEKPIWDAVRSDKPQAWIWTGDAVYSKRKKKYKNKNKKGATGDDRKTDDLRAPDAYANSTLYKSKHGPISPDSLSKLFLRMKTDPKLGYVGFNPPLGTFGTWDDHDFGGNDMGKDMTHLEERQKLWFDFLGLPVPKFIDLNGNIKNEISDGGDMREGVYNSVSWGVAPHKLQVINLDTRWHREDHVIPSVAPYVPLGNAIACVTRWLTAGFLSAESSAKDTKDAPLILGAEQWKWLEHKLETTDAQMILLVSSIQVLTTNPTVESWGQIPAAQKKLVDMVSDFQRRTGKLLVIVSGDVHHAELLGRERLIEVTSSGLTHHCAQAKLYGRMCRPILTHFGSHRYEKAGEDGPAFYIGRNYGILDIDWEGNNAKITIKDGTGNVVLSSEHLILASKDDGAISSTPDWNDIPHTWNRHLLPLFLAALGLLASLFFVPVVPRRNPSLQQ